MRRCRGGARARRRLAGNEPSAEIRDTAPRGHRDDAEPPVPGLRRGAGPGRRVDPPRRGPTRRGAGRVRVTGVALRLGRLRARRRHGALRPSVSDRAPAGPASPARHASAGGDASAERARPDSPDPFGHRPRVPRPPAGARPGRGAPDPGPIGRGGRAGPGGLDGCGPAHVRGSERLRHVLARMGPAARSEPRAGRLGPVAGRGPAARECSSRWARSSCCSSCCVLLR